MRLGKVMARAALPEYSGKENLFRVRVLNADGTSSEIEIIARDTVGANLGDMVLLTEPDEQTAEQIRAPVLILGIVENAEVMAREEIAETSQERLI